MKSEMTFPKRKKLLFGAVAICVVLIAGLTIWSQTGKTAEAAVITPPSPSPPSGLVGWWRFDEGSGIVAADSSGNGNNGTIFGATWVTGKYGQALSFDGTGNYIGSIGSASFWQSLGAKTVEAWIYPTSSGVQMQIVGNRNDANSPPVGFGFGLDSTGYLMTWTYPWTAVVSNLRPTLNAWNFVAMTHVGTTITFWLNGVSNTMTSQQQPSLGGGVLAIGQGGDAYPSERFSGTIDEVRIYNRALSAAEIQTDFQTSPGFASTLLAKIPTGTTQVITTISWQGSGSINATITSPSQTYTESVIPVYQKTTYSTTAGSSGMLNVKRLSVSVTALPADQSWTIALTYSGVAAYQISVEVQK